MNNFGILYGTELKKILSKKAVWITLVFGILFIGVVEMSNMLFEKYDFMDMTMSGFQYEALHREKGEAVSGEVMDDAFYEKIRTEMNEFKTTHEEDIARVIDTERTGYPGLWYCAERCGYEWLLNTESRAIGYGNSDRYKLFMEGTAEEIMDAKRDNIIINMEADGLAEHEKEYWLERYDRIEKPIVYSYSKGYSTFFDCLFVMIWLVFMLIVIGLSGVFADENTYKTDALILSCRNGRTQICLAKLTAGITFSVTFMLIVLGICLFVPLMGFGAKGWNAPIQNVIVTSAFHMSIGQAVIMTFAIAILIAILCGLFTMLLSQVFRNTVPVMAVQTGVLIISIFNLPYSFGMLSQVWALRPTNFLKNFAFIEYRLFPIPGALINCFQMAGVLYAVFSIVFFVVTTRLYRNMQIASR